MEYWFWTIFSLLTIVWYIVVTIIVSYKGGQDIKEMIRKLSKE